MHIETIIAPTAVFEELVDTHVAFCDGTAPAESCHRLPLSALFVPEITVWGVFDGDALVAMGAMKELSATDGEIKSMHTLRAARGKGVGRLILETIVEEARQRGYRALWLETGVHDDFAPARSFYKAGGFSETGPFGSYGPDPHSVFMTLALSEQENAA